MSQGKMIVAGMAVAAALAAGTASAQYSGPGARQAVAPVVLRKVADVLAKPVDDQHVELTGRLVRQTGNEHYVFSDGSGEIQVEIDRDDFPAGKPLDADTRVVIHGEVDTRLARAPEIDVELVSIAPLSSS